MKLQLLCITCDHLVIHKTISTWKDQATRIVVYANGPNKDLIREELKSINNCHTLLGDFIGFSQTRNLLIDLAQTDKFDYNIMIDDSYELIGGSNIISFLEKHKENQLVVSVKTLDEVQKRRLIFKKGRYTGEIHETLEPRGTIGVLDGHYIEDIVYKHHLRRTCDRIDYDLSMLDREPVSRRSIYYRATLLLKKGQVDQAVHLFGQLTTGKDQYSILSKKCLFVINGIKHKQVKTLDLPK